MSARLKLQQDSDPCSVAARFSPDCVFDPALKNQNGDRDDLARITQRSRLRALWRAHVRDNPSTAAQHLLFNFLLDRPAHHGFTPTSNAVKLQNGRHPHEGVRQAANDLLGHRTFQKSFAPFFEWSPDHKTDSILDSILGPGGSAILKNWVADARHAPKDAP